MITREKLLFSLEEIEQAFDGWAKAESVTDKEGIAKAWHGLAVQLMLLGVEKGNQK